MACVASPVRLLRSLWWRYPDQVGDYKLGKVLANGAYGAVWQATNVTTGDVVAVKMVKDEKMTATDLQNEVNNQSRVKHPHVVPIFGLLELGRSTYIVMELMQGGDLRDHLQAQRVPLLENEARLFFRQLMSGLAHCHSRGVIHRDLKLENLLLDSENNLKIADFGLSATMVEGETFSEAAGSLRYAAPEMLRVRCAYNGPEIDIWSCGVILFALLTKSMPFVGDNTYDLKKNIQYVNYIVPHFVHGDAKHMLSRMLSASGDRRITMAQICEHKWLLQHGFENVTASRRTVADPWERDLAFSDRKYGSVLELAEGHSTTDRAARVSRKAAVQRKFGLLRSAAKKIVCCISKDKLEHV